MVGVNRQVYFQRLIPSELEARTLLLWFVGPSRVRYVSAQGLQEPMSGMLSWHAN